MIEKKFYVENVRAFLGVSFASAVKVCDLMCELGEWVKKYELLSKSGKVICTEDSDKVYPETVEYYNSYGELVTKRRDSLTRIVCYHLRDDSQKAVCVNE